MSARPAVEEGKGDGDLCAKCGLPPYVSELQHHHPPNEGGCVGCLDHTFAARPLVQEDDAVALEVKKWQGFEAGVQERVIHVPADDPRDEDDDVETARRAFLTSLWPDYDSNRDAYEHTLRVAALNNYVAAIERRRGVAAPQAGAFTTLEAARLAVGFGDGEDYCGSCGAHWRDIQNGCRLHPLWNVLASTEVVPAVQAGGGDGLSEAADRYTDAFVARLSSSPRPEFIASNAFVAGAEWMRAQAGGGDEAATFLRERPDYIARREFHPLSDRWWRAFQAEPHEFPPHDWETFDEVVAWTLANIPAQAGGGLRAAMEAVRERLFNIGDMTPNAFTTLEAANEWAANVSAHYNAEYSAALAESKRALGATPQGEKE